MHYDTIAPAPFASSAKNHLICPKTKLMKKILDFIWKNRDLALATVGEDGKPKVRVFQVMSIDEGTLFFATGPHKRVYAELQGNPAVEILAFRGDVSVRISGVARFVDDAATQERIYRSNEVLQRLYSRAQDLAYFCVEIENLDYYDLATNPPTFRHYDGTSGQFQTLNPLVNTDLDTVGD